MFENNDHPSRNDKSHHEKLYECSNQIAATYGKWYWTPLALCIFRGIGCAANPEKGLKMLLCSGKAGSTQSYIYAANFYETANHFEQAQNIYQKAVDDGYTLYEDCVQMLKNKRASLPQLPRYTIKSITLSPCNHTITYTQNITTFTECPICEKPVEKSIECLD